LDECTTNTDAKFVTGTIGRKLVFNTQTCNLSLKKSHFYAPNIGFMTFMH